MTHFWELQNDGIVDGVAILVFGFASYISPAPALVTAGLPSGSELLFEGQLANNWVGYVAVPLQAGGTADIPWTIVVPPDAVYGYQPTTDIGNTLFLLSDVIGSITSSQWQGLSSTDTQTTLMQADILEEQNLEEALSEIAGLPTSSLNTYQTTLKASYPNEAIGLFGQQNDWFINEVEDATLMGSLTPSTGSTSSGTVTDQIVVSPDGRWEVSYDPNTESIVIKDLTLPSGYNLSIEGKFGEFVDMQVVNTIPVDIDPSDVSGVLDAVLTAQERTTLDSAGGQIEDGGGLLTIGGWSYWLHNGCGLASQNLGNALAGDPVLNGWGIQQIWVPAPGQAAWQQSVLLTSHSGNYYLINDGGLVPDVVVARMVKIQSNPDTWTLPSQTVNWSMFWLLGALTLTDPHNVQWVISAAANPNFPPPCCPVPPSVYGPPVEGTETDPNLTSVLVSSFDPNEMGTNPAGVGNQGCGSESQPMTYVINFENQASATATRGKHPSGRQA